MINAIIERYKEYGFRYDVKDKMLITHKPILVKDFINIKNIIREYNLEIDEIRIIGRCR